MSTDETLPAPPMPPPVKTKDGSLDATLPAGASGQAAATLAPVDPQRYEVGGELARGGLGRIRRARDVRLDRPVAIKELLRLDDADHTRFAREALVTARLMHPAIVPVYEAGVWPDGAPFYAMKLVEGRSLEHAIAQTVEPAERLALLPRVIDVAHALAYAHERKIIHRDLKPANVLVGAHGETVVIDWGLAKDLAATSTSDSSRTTAPGRAPLGAASRGSHPSGSDVGATVEGTVMGTPAYMPPEQARGELVDERADVYAIGALLYHVLSGEAPYRGRTSAEVLRAVLDGPPEPIEAAAPGLPPDLAAIVHRAMAYEPRDRYPSARELAEDLTRFQSGQLVSAHRYSTGALLARFLRRHRAAVGVAVVALALATVFGVLGVRRLVDAKRRAEAARAQAERERLRADERADQLAVSQARLALDDDPSAALAWLARVSPQFGGWRVARAIASEALARGVPEARLPVGEALRGADASSDGGLIAVTGTGGGVVVLDAASGQRVRLAGGPGAPALFVPGARVVVRAAAHGVPEVWDPRYGQPRPLGAGGADRHKGEIAAIALAGPADAALVATGGGDGAVRLWPVAGGASRVIGAKGPVARVALAPDGARVAAALADGTVQLWDAKSGAALGEHASGAPVAALELSPDGRWLAAAAGTRVILWDLAGKTPVVSERDGHRGEALALAFSPDSRLLFSGGRDRRVLAWTLAPGACPAVGGGDAAKAIAPSLLDLAGKAAREIGSHEKGVELLRVAPGGRFVLAGGGARVSVLPVCPTHGAGAAEGADARVRHLAGHRAPVVAILFSADGKRLVTADEQGDVLTWSPGRFLGDRAELDGPIAAVAASPGLVVAAEGDGRVVAWRGHELAPLYAHDGRVSGLAVSADGRVVASGGWDDRVRVWDGAARELLRRARDVTAIALSLDGARVAAAAGDGTIAIVEVATGRAQILGEPGAAIRLLAATPDGGLVAAAGEDGVLRVWDRATGKAIARQDPGALVALAIAPDGRACAWATAEGRVAVWRFREGHVALMPAGEPGASALVGFAGRWLISAGEAGATRWDPELGEGRRIAVGPVRALAAAPDGHAVALGGADGGVRLVDAETLDVWLGGRVGGAVTALAWLPDGSALVAGGDSGELVRVLDDLPADAAGLRKMLPRADESLDKPRANP